MTQGSEVNSVTEPSVLKVIPIAEGPICISRKLNHVKDLLLKPFIKEGKSCTKGSTHFLNKSQLEVCDDTIDIACNMITLYTRIPTQFRYLSNKQLFN